MKLTTFPTKAKKKSKPAPAPREANKTEAVGVEPQYSQVKVTLVNTPLKEQTLLNRLKKYKGHLGFDTEAVGPNLRGRNFINITKSTMLGVSLAFEDGKTFYLPVCHKGNNISYWGLDRIMVEVQKAALESRVWAHNAKFDQQVATMAGYPLRGLLDSMVAAWLVLGKNYGLGLKQLAEDILGRTSPQYDPAIHAKTGDEVKIYAGHDALNTLELGLHFRPMLEECPGWDWFLEECEFAHTLADMKLLGMRINLKKLMALRDRAQADLDEILKVWKEWAPDVSITSSKDLQEFFEEGTWTAKGKTSGGKFATGKTVMQWNLKNAKTTAGQGFAWMRLAYQEVAKIRSTYTEGLVEEARQWADSKLHCDLFHFGTVTGRLASANPNLQNQPAHGDWAKFVRECFIPDDGKEFTSADYSQIELRYFAEYCGGRLLKAYSRNEDIHQLTADAMKITRQKGKTVNFGFLLYGGGPDKLATEVGCSKSEAEMKIAALHKLYPSVEKWRQEVITTVGGSIEWNDWGQPEIVGGRGENPWAVTLMGRKRHFPELNPDYLKRTDPEEYDKLATKYKFNCRVRGKKPSKQGLWMSIRARGERLVVNYLIQGGTRDLLVMGMNRYRMMAPEGFEIVMTVHDEVLTQHPIGEGVVGRQLLKDSLEHVGQRVGLEVPIVAEPVTGANWSEVK